MLLRVDTYSQLADEANGKARSYVGQIYEDQHWEYVLPLLEAKRIELAIPTPSPTNTEVVTPEDRDAL